MLRTSVGLLALLAPMLLAGASALAQAPIVRRDPVEAFPPPSTVSPYLHLTNRNAAAAQYQTMVRPLLEQREAQWRSGSAGRFAGARVAPSSSVRPAGARRSLAQEPRFMNFSHYYRGLR